MRLFALLAITLLTAACSSEQGDESTAALTGAVEAAAAPVILVPTTDAPRAECAAELAVTYCSEASARAAARACAARLVGDDGKGCYDGACLALFTPDRAPMGPAGCVEGLTYPNVASCQAPLVDDCAFYRTCLDPVHACGEDGYPLGFGERICNAFIAQRERFSPAGQVWLQGIRQCLEESLVPTLGQTLSCDALEDAAYKAHTPCYTDPAHSICDLSIPDSLTLTTILGKDLLNSRTLKEVNTILAACRKQP